MTAPVFVDTNVLIYARDTRDAAKQARASEWLDYVWREQLGRTSMQVLSEYYVNVTRKLRPGLPRDDAWEDVTSLLVWKPQATDAMLMERGRQLEQRYRLSWWDSLVVAAAQLQGCALLLTEDLHDGAHFGGVRVRSPFSIAVGEPIEDYALPEVTRRPPMRGRPRGSRGARAVIR